jgi:hypothetical protein
LHEIESFNKVDNVTSKRLQTRIRTLAPFSRLLVLKNGLDQSLDIWSKKHPLKYLESMNTVLAQELLRYNRLNGVIISSLKSAKLAIKGEVPLTPDIEALI